MKFDWKNLGLGCGLGLVLFALLGAASVQKNGIFEGIQLGGTTNIVTDNGTALTRNGVAIGGGGGSGPWTNSAGFIYPAGTTLSNTTPIVFRYDGALWIGTNAWQDEPLSSPTVWFPEVVSQVLSNDPPLISFNWLSTDNENYDYFAEIEGSVQTDQTSPSTTMAWASMSTNSLAQRIDFVLTPASPFNDPIAYSYGGTNLFSVGFDGKVTGTGIFDPPSVLYDANTRSNVVRQALAQLDSHNADAALQFFNRETKRMEFLIPGEGTFWDMAGNKLDTIAPLKLKAPRTNAVASNPAQKRKHPAAH